MANELLTILEYIEQERGISRESLVRALESAILTASRKSIHPASELKVKIDPATGQIQAWAMLEVVESNPTCDQLVIARARERFPEAQLGDIVESSLKAANLWDELKDQLHKSALALSGGQQQRLCIARALAIKPEILLMDEPTSALDPISTGKIEELCEKLKEELTVVIVTHNMQQAARISDDTAFFLLGELIEFGPTDKIFASPEKEQTLNYISGRFG